MSEQHAPHVPDRVRDGDSSQPVRILFVDDHRDTRIVMQKVLEHWGYQVYIADSVKAALDIARASHPDLLISDIELPDGNGLELFRALQSVTPIQGIVHSGYGMQEDVVRSLEAGFYEHLVKPVALTKLRAAIGRLIPFQRVLSSMA